MNHPEPGLDAPASVDPAEPLPQRAACPLVPGGRWKGYKIERPAPQGPDGCFEALRLDNMEGVLVRATPLGDTTEWRRGAWQRLAELEDLAVVGPIEAIEEEGWRFEISRRPPASTLLEWFACHKAGYESVEALTRQLAAVLDAMHAQGIVHLNLRPDTVYVDESGEGLRIVVGGLHEATLYTQSTVELATVDPLYAPPEAAGRHRFPPGTGLCAWDWWSVGRILQQFLLGRHVAAVLKPEAAKDDAALRRAAGQLLLEREPPGMRAGAVEAMGPVDPVLKTLLQGLLTSSRDARWTGAEVGRWLARETVRVHYELPTGARLFVWKGRGLTLAAAAEFFVTDEAWDDGEFNLFSPDDPSSLVAFLRDEPAQAATLALLEKHIDWVNQAEWAQVPPHTRRAIAAGVAWMALAQSQGQRAALVLRGRVIDADGLTALFDAIGASAAVALARGLMEPHFVERLASLDPEAATVLSGLSALGGDAQQHALAEGWIDAADEEAHVRILCLALEPRAALTARVEKVRANYASSREPGLAGFLADRAAPAWAQVLLAYTGERAAHFGYVTHAHWRRERIAALDEGIDRLRAAIFWHRLQRVLLFGFVGGASWRGIGYMAAGLLAIGGLAAGRPALALAIAGAVAVARWYAPSLLARWTARYDASASRWTREDTWRRCRQEVMRLCPAGAPLSLLCAELAQREAARAELAPAETRFPPAPDLRPLWAGFGAASVALAVAGAYFVQAAVPRVGAMLTSLGRTPAAAVAAEVAVPPVVPETPVEEAAVASGQFEYIDDGFGGRLRGPLQPWTLYAPSTPLERLPIEEARPATPWQRAHALVNLELLLLPYARDAVHALIAVRVPSGDGRTELMILNSRSRRPFQDDALRMARDLEERTWYQYDRRRVLFLGDPRSAGGEISLAPP